MRAQGIVKGFNIGENIRLSRTAGIIPAQVNQFAFEAAEKVFRYSVVAGVAFAGHTLPDTQGRQPVSEGRSSILNTPVWKISPDSGRSRRIAMFSAARVNWVSMRLEKA